MRLPVKLQSNRCVCARLLRQRGAIRRQSAIRNPQFAIPLSVRLWDHVFPEPRSGEVVFGASFLDCDLAVTDNDLDIVTNVLG